MHIAYVACNKNAQRFRENPSFIYRCENMALALRRLGHQVSLLHLQEFCSTAPYDVVVFHRPRLSWRLRRVLRSLRQQKTLVCADIDDLVIDESFVGFNPGVVNQQVSKRSISRLYRDHRKALERVACISVSTEPLAEEVKKRFPEADVCLITNAVHLKWFDLPFPDTKPEKKIITYFPGTRSHNKDFSVVTKALERFLAENEEVQLNVTGPLTFSIQARPGQVQHREKVPFAQFSSLFTESWLNLAPLEMTPFTRCKSAVKVLEAGFWNTPTLCTPIPDTKRFNGAGALQAVDEGDWYGHLNAMLEASTYARETDGLRNKIIERANAVDEAGRFVAFIQKKQQGA